MNILNSGSNISKLLLKVTTSFKFRNIFKEIIGINNKYNRKRFKVYFRNFTFIEIVFN